MKLDHVTILTDDVDGTTSFFRDALGFEPGPRPPFSFAGAWLYDEGVPLVHLKAPKPVPDGAVSALEHIAFCTRDFDAAVARLQRLGLRIRVGGLPDGSRRQCFFHDPNGVLIEITD